MSASKTEDSTCTRKTDKVKDAKLAPMEPMVNTIPDMDKKSTFCKKFPIFRTNHYRKR